ncbi:MAG: diaminopimelate decarboxylase [Candidatus Omnitrophica bacterium]|nr:diaminopimelate decarboxylase [Candidatus Omnitrophota bacterium]MDD5352686.1 diaminopimelate decarboxylase [Candidatus Omnitrophota bacterium]MDD5550285.1 diaminopimelate decarboxylase [Candidatus Omnitrophota bacterium]
MHYFNYKTNNLYCEEVRVSDIVEKFGSPCYVYSYRTLIEHFRKLQAAFKEINPLICYSVKANSNLAICKALVNAGAGLDIVSGGELYRALKIRTNPKKIVFAGVGKTDEEITYAIKSGILFFNVESEAEMESIQELAIKLRRTVNVCLRINPEVDPHTHRYIKTAQKESKFGLSFSAARLLLLNRERFFNVNIKGLHIHIGSQITEARPYIQAVAKVSEFIKEMKSAGIKFEYLNIGGGMGIIYKKETTQTANVFARAIIPLLKNTGLKIILEPGRFIVGSAGILVSRVTYVKETELKNFLIVDSGMSDLIRPSLYDAYHEIVPLRKKSKSRQKKYDIVGPICESGDFLAKDRIMPQTEAGEYVAIMCSGAYGFSMSSNYNSRPRAAEILVKGNEYSVIKPRESYLDLVRKEKIPRFI